jgi:hypothetical protein
MDLSARHEPIEGPSAWLGRNVQPQDYRVELVACHDEVRRMVDELRSFPLTIVLRPEDFARPPAARPWLGRVVFSMSARACHRRPPARCRWIRARRRRSPPSEHDLRPVAQYLTAPDLRCSRHRQEALLDRGAPDKTNIEIRFHNDNVDNDTRPTMSGCSPAPGDGGGPAA